MRSRAEAKSRNQLISSKYSTNISSNKETLVEHNLLKSSEPSVTSSDKKMNLKRLNISLAKSLNNVSVKSLVFLLVLIVKVRYI